MLRVAKSLGVVVLQAAVCRFCAAEADRAEEDRRVAVFALRLQLLAVKIAHRIFMGKRRLSEKSMSHGREKLMMRNQPPLLDLPKANAAGKHRARWHGGVLL